MRARRTFGSALWSRATPAYLYNTCLEVPVRARPVGADAGQRLSSIAAKTSCGAANVFDQLLVRSDLRGGFLPAPKGSVGFATSDHLTSEYNRRDRWFRCLSMFPQQNTKGLGSFSVNRHISVSLRRRRWLPLLLRHQLNATLAGSPHEPYLRMFDELNAWRAPRTWLRPAARLSSLSVEPGFRRDRAAIQYRVHIRDRECRTRFRAMSHQTARPPRLFRREPTILTDENELQRRVLES